MKVIICDTLYYISDYMSDTIYPATPNRIRSLIHRSVLTDVLDTSNHVLLLRPEEQFLIMFKILSLPSHNLVHIPGRFVPGNTRLTSGYFGRVESPILLVLSLLTVTEVKTFWTLVLFNSNLVQILPKYHLF